MAVDCLLFRVHERTGAIPLAHVVEVMRPLPIRTIASAPAFVLGAAVIRGEAVPVVDAASLLGAPRRAPTRFVTLRVGARRVALAVGEVLGASRIDAGAFAGVPPLFAGAGDAVASLGAIDAELFVLLEAARLVPESLSVGEAP